MRRKTPKTELDVDDELAQLLKEQEEFMRGSKRPAAKVTRRAAAPGSSSSASASQSASGATASADSPPMIQQHAEENAVKAGEEEEEEEEAPSVVGQVVERDVVQLNASNASIMPRREVGGFPVVTRRGRDSVFGRRQRKPTTGRIAATTAMPPAASMLSGRGRIVERAPAVQGTASLSAASRSDVVSADEWADIDASNRSALASMSVAEIREAQRELQNSLDPELLAKLAGRRRQTASPPADQPVAEVMNPVTATSRTNAVSEPSSGIDLSKITTEEELTAQAQYLPAEERAKHAWMQPSTNDGTRKRPHVSAVRRHQQAAKKEPVASSERFDFNGDRVSGATATTAVDDEEVTSSTRAAPVSSGLYHHGDEPEAAGYTMDELLHLARSTVASQRAMALVTISKILTKRQHQQRLQQRPEPQTLPRTLPIALRMALDDNNYTALSAAIAALHAFLVPAGGLMEGDASIDEADHFEATAGTILLPPLLHLHRDAGTRADDLLEQVIYLDTSESPEDGSALGDEELVALDPVQGFVKMQLVARVAYVMTRLQLPDSNAMDKLLDILLQLARHSPRTALAMAQNRALIKSIQTKYIENTRVLTLQYDPQDQEETPTEASAKFAEAVLATHKALVLIRVLCQSDRQAAAMLQERGVIQSTKGFLALKASADEAVAGAAAMHLLEPVQLESLRIWRVLLGYGMDFHCFSYLYPLLCGFDGVQLVRTSAGHHGYSDQLLAALFAALAAMARLDTLHEAQHYFSQFGLFVAQAKGEIVARTARLTQDSTNDCRDSNTRDDTVMVVVTALRFLTACSHLVAKFHLDRNVYTEVLSCITTLPWNHVDLWASNDTSLAHELVTAVAHFGEQVLSNDLLNDDDDDDDVRLHLFQALNPALRHCLQFDTPNNTPSGNTVTSTCDLLLITAQLIMQTSRYAGAVDGSLLHAVYARGLDMIPHLTVGHQHWVHRLFTGLLFHPTFLQMTELFPHAADAGAMSHVLVPIYQALLNTSLDQEQHSLRLFDPYQASPLEKPSCHLVIPVEEAAYVAVNLPLPSYWLYCPFSRLEYANTTSGSSPSQPAPPSPSSPAAVDEMKVVVSTACRYLNQLETTSSSSRTLTMNHNKMGDDDKLFHLLHVLLAGSDVLFDERVEAPLSSLIHKYARYLLLRRLHDDPVTTTHSLFDSLLRNLRRMEHLDADAQTDETPASSSTPTTAFASETDTVQHFVERLVHEFTAASYGHALVARAVALFLLPEFPLSTRQWVWRELLESHLLHRLEPFMDPNNREETIMLAMATYTSCTRHAQHTDEKLLQLMAQSVAPSSRISGSSAPLSAAKGRFAYWIAVHHLVVYFFGGEHAQHTTSETMAGVDGHEDKLMSLSRQRLLEQLATHASKELWHHLLQYDTTTASLSGVHVAAEVGSAASMAPVASPQARRVEILRTRGGLHADQLAQVMLMMVSEAS